MPADLTNQREWDAIVIGGGPAGSLAAYRLATRGYSVLLVDQGKRGRPKVCGGCLGAVGLAALDDAGLTLQTLGVESLPLDRLEIRSGSRRADLHLAERRSIARDRFDQRLLTAAESAGASVLSGRPARVGPIDGTWRSVRVGTSTLRARVVLIAAGLGSHRLLPRSDQPELHMSRSRRIGAGTLLPAEHHCHPPGVVTMVCGRPDEGYVGLATLPDSRLDVAAAIEPAALAGGADRVPQLIETMLRRARIDAVDVGGQSGRWRSTPRLTQRPTTLATERVLLIGDAAGYVEPFTGEGIGWALRSALAVEPIADAGIDRWRDGLVQEWNKAHDAVIGSQQRRCHAVCQAIGARWATSKLIRMLAVAPWLARPVLRSIDPAPVRRD